MSSQPTEPVARVSAPPVDGGGDLFAMGGEEIHVDYRPTTTGGAPRRDDDGAAERRWPWLAALAALAVLGLSGLGWLLARVPQPDYRQAAPTVSPSVSSTAAPAETTVGSTAPPPTVTAVATSGSPTSEIPTSTPPAPSTSPARSTAPGTTPRPAPTLPRMVTVPNVVGKRTAAATATLRSAGFSVATASVPTAKRREIGRVISQSPSAGSTATRGSVVTIFVGAPG
jgi:cytoskeletal protein RodZ